MTEQVSSECREPRLSPAFELQLKRNVHAPARARAAIQEMSGPLRLRGSTLQTLLLLASEIVTNAVVHSAGPRDAPITLAASAGADTVRITVTDAGSGFTPRRRDPASIRDGYGLYLLERAASRWGVESTGPTSVWFELPLS